MAAGETHHMLLAPQRMWCVSKTKSRCREVSRDLSIRQAAYRSQLTALLPTGRAWATESDPALADLSRRWH
ncbi:hypothetical protein J4530_08845 [Neisseria subflava]|uniref:hypothetical protein n=1 Tax=Neisseria subflava TaxID=28449 RepID=UPI00202A38F8|nr:hypothetical protein [Neisseria subflava]MCL9788260.1 hypothetical protein [Neisseria subflava]